MTLEVAVVMLVFMNHRLGPLAAASVGASLTAGYVLVHLSPARTWLSDSLTAGEDITRFSWFAVAGLIATSALLAVAGWSVLRRDGVASAVQQAEPAGSVLHPVTTAMVIGNVLILAGSVATL